MAGVTSGQGSPVYNPTAQKQSSLLPPHSMKVVGLIPELAPFLCPASKCLLGSLPVLTVSAGFLSGSTVPAGLSPGSQSVCWVLSRVFLSLLGSLWVFPVSAMFFSRFFQSLLGCLWVPLCHLVLLCLLRSLHVLHYLLGYLQVLPVYAGFSPFFLMCLVGSLYVLLLPPTVLKEVKLRL